jgi:surfactin synthase thioesterase subunit
VHRSWLAGRDPDPGAAVRLFCLPYAGGNASAYHGWRDVAPEHINVCTVEFPGRGSRLGEDPFIRLAPLVRTLADALLPILDRPFALFGHSLGGLIAFELVRLLRRRGGPLPAHLFISATRAPTTPSPLPAVRDASLAEMKDYLRTINGTPDAILQDDELMGLLLPVLRADFSVLETYEYRDEPPLRVPLTLFAGAADPVVPLSALAGWRRQSRGYRRMHVFPGDHFFLHETGPELLATIAEALRPDVPADQVLERSGGTIHG